MAQQQDEPMTGAASVLTGLRAAGVDYLFANAGTDFPPIIEALAAAEPGTVPEPLTIPHETAAVGMAHGHYLVTGRMQAVMVHVNVGLANAAMGVINAASDDVPVLIMSGRTPITEKGRPGARVTPIQYGQEMYDQTSIVRDVVKFSYEMRYPEQGAELVARAAAVARSAPEGPAYLSLPREPLADACPPGATPPPVPPPARPAAPDPGAIEELARWLAVAVRPVLLCQRGDTGGALGPAVSAFAQRYGVAVAEPFTVRNLLASDDPALLGYDGGKALRGADLVIVLDSAVPWTVALGAPDAGARVAHIAPDPHFARHPMRGYRVDLAIAADPAAAIAALDRTATPGPKAAQRAAATAAAAEERKIAAEASAKTGSGTPMAVEWLSRCVSNVMDEDAVAFTELGLVPQAMRLRGQNRLFTAPHSAGLGWAMPAALGAQLADRDRLVIACMGDGSYMFANPVACHQVAEALELPILTVIRNNAMWNAVRRSVVGAYPDGAAAATNLMPLTSLEPLPDFAAVARASRAHAERVEDGRDLPAALARAVDVIRHERRQALLDVHVAVSDRF